MSEYLKVWLDNQPKPIITLLSMKKMEEYLPTSFMRIHRSYIVNLTKIQEVNKNRVILDANTYLPIGDLYKEAFQTYLDTKFLNDMDKNAIKREQSQARLNYAERSILREAKIIMTLLALMLTVNLSAQVDRPQMGQQPLQNNQRPNRPSGGRPEGRPGGQRPGMPPGGPGGPGSRQRDITYAGATTLTAAATETSKTYESSKADECALLISTKEAVTISQPTISKTGDSDGGDNSSFYGVNAALLVKDGSTTTIKGGNIVTNGMGANGVFSYGGNGGRNGGLGDGTTVIIEDTKITTTGGGSGGIMTTGGGVTKAKNLTVNTSGRSSAPIRSDRGGGVVTVEGGSYTSNGQGSPVIYSTADITVSDAVLTSNMSEGAVIEGKNSITLNNCQMTVSNTRRNGHAQFQDAIMIYQSFSGDAATGNSHFTINGGMLTNRQGHLIHVTNTNAIITLNGVKLVNDDPAKVLLSVCADGWQGAGNKATFNAVSQKLEGTILVGSDSELTMTLSDGSTFTGSIGGNITNAEGNTISTETGKVDVTLGNGCTWTLTADTHITSFTGDASRVTLNGHRLYVNGKEMKTY